jgi:ATP-dependent RNA helicase DDX24/MAK5
MKGPWRKVDVALPEGDDRNHYYTDDSGSNHHHRRCRTDPHDLEAEPGEAVGIFLGLEVIDGSQYTLERSNTTSNHCIMKIQKKMESDGADEGERQQPKKRRNHETSGSELDTHERTSPSSDGCPIDVEKHRKKKKQKKKKKNSKSLEEKKGQRKDPPDSMESNAVDDDDNDKDEEDMEENNQSMIQDLQFQWMSATGGVQLHEQLCRGLYRQGFRDPSPIQAATLPVAILGRRNVVGAAPTGSGKTLAFLLPIFQFLLEEEHRPSEFKALILSPTRELALQIYQEAIKLSSQKSMIACLTGGLAIAKQQRVLSNRPPVIVATPGRLWDLVGVGTTDVWLSGWKMCCQGRNSQKKNATSLIRIYTLKSKIFARFSETFLTQCIDFFLCQWSTLLTHTFYLFVLLSDFQP